MSRSTTERVRREPHQSQWLALLVGLFYTLLGLAGFAVTLDVPFAGPEGGQLIGMSLNSLANLVHLVVGLAGILAWRRLAWTIRYGWGLAAVMALLFGWGILVGDDAPANLLALDNTTDGVHAITAVYGIAMAIWPAGQAQTTPAIDEARGKERDGGRPSPR